MLADLSEPLPAAATAGVGVISASVIRSAEEQIHRFFSLLLFVPFGLMFSQMQQQNSELTNFPICQTVSRNKSILFFNRAFSYL